MRKGSKHKPESKAKISRSKTLKGPEATLEAQVEWARLRYTKLLLKQLEEAQKG